MRFISLGVDAGEDVIRLADKGDRFYTNFKSFIVFTKGGKYMYSTASADRSLKAYISGYLEDMARLMRRIKGEGVERIELLRTTDATEFSTRSRETFLMRELYLYKGKNSSVYLPNVRYTRIVDTSVAHKFEVAYSPPELRRRRDVGSVVHFLYAIKERKKDISSSISFEQQPMLLA